MWQFTKKLLSGAVGFVSGLVPAALFILPSLPQLPHRFYTAFVATQNWIGTSTTRRILGFIPSVVAGAIYSVAHLPIEGAIAGFKNGFTAGFKMPWKIACGFNPRSYRPAEITQDRQSIETTRVRNEQQRAEQQQELDRIQRERNLLQGGNPATRFRSPSADTDDLQMQWALAESARAASVPPFPVGIAAARGRPQSTPPFTPFQGAPLSWRI